MFNEIALKSRSYRGFDRSVKITDAQLNEMVDLARKCSCGMNKQALRYIISNDDVTNDIIFKQTKWAGSLGKTLPFEGQEPVAYVIVCLDSEVFKERTRYDVEIGIAAQTLMLKAVEMGFGGCMIGAYNHVELEKNLKVPERYMTRLVLALGKPIETIVLEEAKDGNVQYYRDENNVHYVPKLPLEEVIIHCDL